MLVMKEHLQKAHKRSYLLSLFHNVNSLCFESSLSIRGVQKTPLQCGIGGRRRFKGKKKKKSQRETDRGEERGVEKVRGKKG